MRLKTRVGQFAVPLAVLLCCGSSDRSVLAVSQNQPAPKIEGAIWTLDLPSEIKWHRTTLSDVPLIQTDHALIGINGMTGEKLWELPGVVVDRDDVNEMADVLLINSRTRAQDSEPRLIAVETLTGKVRWDNRQVGGRTLLTVNLLDRGQVLLVNSTKISKGTAGAMVKQFALGFGGDKRLSVNPDLYLVDIKDGHVVWQQQYHRKVELFKGTSTFGSTQFTITGSPEPAVDKDFIYFPWSGFAKYELATGKEVWGVDYDTTLEDLHNTGTYAVRDNVAYSSETGVVRAIDLSSGKILWATKGLGEAVPQLIVEDDAIYAKLGGVLYHSGKGEYVPVGKKGLAALDRQTGKVIWKFEKFQNNTTNAVPWKTGFLLADQSMVYGVGRNGQELFRQPIKVTQDRLPFSCELRDENLLEIRSEQQRLMVNLDSKTEVFNVSLKKPDVPAWRTLVGVAILVGGQAAGSAMGGSSSLAGQLAAVGAVVASQLVAARVMTRTQELQRYDFFLAAGEQDDKSKRIVRVDRTTGATRTVASYGKLDVVPVIDPQFGRVYSSAGRTLIAHDLVADH